MFPLNLLLELVPIEHFERVKGLGELRVNKSGFPVIWALWVQARGGRGVQFIPSVCSINHRS